MQAQILTLRGRPAQVADTLDWLETTIREAGNSDYIVVGLASAALARAALGQHDGPPPCSPRSRRPRRPRDRELRRLPAGDGAHRPRVGNPELAQRLVAGVEPRNPYAEHALAAANAALAEAHGDLEAAAEGYADAAQRWQASVSFPSRRSPSSARAAASSHSAEPTEAGQSLQQAREIFQELQAAPALAETDALLQQATALSS